MELVKQLEFLNPTEIHDEIHIIGLGAMGSTVASMLARMGFTNMHLYDFDTVEDKNICNQTFYQCDIGHTKVDAVINMVHNINPEAHCIPHNKGWQPFTPMSGYVFICVDSIELRNAIVDNMMMLTNIIGVFDFRMGLTDAQTYAAKWNKPNDIKKLKATMAFTDEEAKASMPLSACGTTLSVRPTVVMAVAYGIANFVNMLKNEPYHTAIIFDAFNTNVTAFKA